MSEPPPREIAWLALPAMALFQEGKGEEAEKPTFFFLLTVFNCDATVWPSAMYKLLLLNNGNFVHVRLCC